MGVSESKQIDVLQRQVYAILKEVRMQSVGIDALIHEQRVVINELRTVNRRVDDLVGLGSTRKIIWPSRGTDAPPTRAEAPPSESPANSVDRCENRTCERTAPSTS